MSDLRSVLLLLLLLAAVATIARLLHAAPRPRTRALRMVAAVGLTALAGVWMLANESVEGAVLISLAEHRGVTVADLPAVALFGFAVALAAWPRRSSAPPP